MFKNCKNQIFLINRWLPSWWTRRRKRSLAIRGHAQVSQAASRTLKDYIWAQTKAQDRNSTLSRCKTSNSTRLSSIIQKKSNLNLERTKKRSPPIRSKCRNKSLRILKIKYSKTRIYLPNSKCLSEMEKLLILRCLFWI